MTDQWSNFYFLCGSSAAGLTGLMFIAITFGASLIKKSDLERVNVFFSPIVFHFIQVFLLACIATAPTTTGFVLAICAAASGLARLIRMPKAWSIIKAAHVEHLDIELSDWLQVVILPAVVYLGFIADGIAFLTDMSFARNLFAATLVLLLGTGVWAAWDMMLWLVTREETKSKTPGEISRRPNRLRIRTREF